MKGFCWFSRSGTGTNVSDIAGNLAMPLQYGAAAVRQRWELGRCRKKAQHGGGSLLYSLTFVLEGISGADSLTFVLQGISGADFLVHCGGNQRRRFTRINFGVDSLIVVRLSVRPWLNHAKTGQPIHIFDTISIYREHGNSHRLKFSIISDPIWFYHKNTI